MVVKLHASYVSAVLPKDRSLDKYKLEKEIKMEEDFTTYLDILRKWEIQKIEKLCVFKNDCMTLLTWTRTRTDVSILTMIFLRTQTVRQ
jgi:hypothetical protein